MLRRTLLGLSLAALTALLGVESRAAEPIGLPKGVSADDWPWWRGPHRVGVAPTAEAPTKWSEDENVRWRTKVPGRGHSSPTVAGNRVYLTTADEVQQTQMVLAFDRATGKEVWRTAVHTGKLGKVGNGRGTYASGSVACDGERLYVNFLNDGTVHATALSLEGVVLWQKPISPFVNHQGFGASPAVYGEIVLFSADNKGGGALAALDGKTGETVWRVERPKKANYTSPILLDVSGKHQAIFAGCDLVTSLDPKSGEKLWEVEGATTECVTSLVPAAGHVFTSGGYPRNHIQAVRTDGSGATSWDNNTRVYVPSMVAKGDYLYVVTDSGTAVCHEAKTGEEAWKARIGGKFNASLVLVGDLVYATAEDGKTTIFRASPEEFEVVATNELGRQVFSSMSICGGHVYHRVVGVQKETRQEWLYCIGE